MSRKTTGGNFFEDFAVGQVFEQPVPRVVTEGDLSLYTALTGDRWPLHYSPDYASGLGWWPQPVVPDLLTFHIVFGGVVRYTSLNSPANLGYADVQFRKDLHPGDSLQTKVTVLGKRETSRGNVGIVWFETLGFNGAGGLVLSFNRWCMVNKRDPKTKTEHEDPPKLPEIVAVGNLLVPPHIKPLGFDPYAAGGGGHLWGDYEVGERISHPQARTVEDAEHQMATALYHNTARVHFNEHMQKGSRLGTRIVYGGHVISVCHALSFDGLENALRILAINAGTHANPTVAGDTLFAWTDVIGKIPLPSPNTSEVEREDLGALRLRLVGVKNLDPNEEEITLKEPDPEREGRERYHPNVVLDLDYTVLMPRAVVGK